MARKRKLPDGMWQRGKVYYARFRANGRVVRKRLATDFKVACELLNELKARAQRADFGLLDNDCSWDELKAEFLRWAKQNVRNPQDYERDLRRMEEYCRVRSIRQVDHNYLYAFREWRLSHGKTPRTVNRETGTLNNMLNRGVEWGKIGNNPIGGVNPLCHDDPVKQRRSLSVDEVNALFDNSPDNLKRVWRMFMVTGIRREELVNMKFDDVDFDRGVVTVRAGTAKNHRRREIPLDDDMLATIAALKAEAKDREPVRSRNADLTERQRRNFSRDHVFVTRVNTPMRNNLLTRFYTCCKRASIEGAHSGGSVDIHSLRVSFTTIALENGAKPKSVQEILGHSTLALTMGVYAKATDRSKREVVSALPFAKSSTPDHVISLPDAHTARTSRSESAQDVGSKRIG